MGLLSLQLEKLISFNKKAIFQTFYQPGKTFFQFKKEMEKEYPPVIYSGKLVSGFLPVTEAKEDSLFGAYLLI